MVALKQIYKCNICGNIVEVVRVGGGQLVCCGQPMELLEEKSEDQGKEKHVPILEETDKGIKVAVGSIPHPMDKEHYIEWIEIKNGGQYCRKFLSPSDSPEFEFGKLAGEKVSARIYCNVHGLWKNG